MELRQEILLNVLLFIPLGVLIGLQYRLRPMQVFLIGVFFSAMIETTQLITCRGLFEWDDILHNGLGALVGCGIGRRLHLLHGTLFEEEY